MSSEAATERLAKEAAYRYERWRASERVAEQRIATLIAAYTLSIGALALAGPSKTDATVPYALIALCDAVLGFGTGVRLIHSRRSIVREIRLLNLVRQREVALLPTEVRATFEKVRNADNHPPPVFKFFSMPNGAAMGGAVMLTLAGYWGIDTGWFGASTGGAAALVGLLIFLGVYKSLADTFSAQLDNDLR